MQQRWRAVWWEDGKRKTFIFDSINSRMIARIDARLKSPYAGVKLPEHFDLEEIGHGNRPDLIPRRLYQEHPSGTRWESGGESRWKPSTDFSSGNPIRGRWKV